MGGLAAGVQRSTLKRKAVDVLAAVFGVRQSCCFFVQGDVHAQGLTLAAGAGVAAAGAWQMLVGGGSGECFAVHPEEECAGV